MTLHAVLVHGMGRTPLSMRGLAGKLAACGIQTHLFGYSATFESFESCTQRLAATINAKAGDSFILIGHSLGSVLLRAVLPSLKTPPLACFFLAPPTKACRAAKFFGSNVLYRLINGAMGKMLGDDAFMNSLPVPSVPTIVYAGNAGPRGQLSPFKDEINDGILGLSETKISGSRTVCVAALHSFIMHAPRVAEDIVSTVKELSKAADVTPRPAT